jgi:hypothetical protein
MKETPPPWRTSAAKQKLSKMIEDPSNEIHRKDFNEIHNMNDLLKVYERKRFKQNFDCLYKTITGHPHQPKTNDNKKTNGEKVPQVAKKESRTMEEQPAKAFLRKLLLDPKNAQSAGSKTDSQLASSFQQYISNCFNLSLLNSLKLICFLSIIEL